jgi:alkanesulfonate monooxygenase SsuD/methylene tetrahydromethanopterin reductase-like flavin-dependent oxidoreductase (luciferase family)
MWFGGQSLHPALLRRLVRYGHGFHPFGSPAPEELERLRSALAEAGRDPAELEMVGGIRGTFADETSTAVLARAVEAIPGQLAQGYTSICFKPSMFTDDVAEVGPLCRDLVARVAAL